jgi:hypothetical protein
VLLDHWSVAPAPDGGAFTTVASWRGPFGPVRHHGGWLGGKARELRALVGLPALVDVPLEVALQIDAADAADRRALEHHGWRVVPATTVAGDPCSFRRYVQASAGELSVAQGLYVHARTGWFGDRTTRYLATGRPAVVQDTGFSADLPVGEGLLAFTDLAGAAAALEQVAADPEHHRRAARRWPRSTSTPVGSWPGCARRSTLPRERLRILVAGMVAGVPGHGGATWAVLQWVLGLRGLGHDVLLVEPGPHRQPRRHVVLRHRRRRRRHRGRAVLWSPDGTWGMAAQATATSPPPQTWW